MRVPLVVCDGIMPHTSVRSSSGAGQEQQMPRQGSLGRPISPQPSAGWALRAVPTNHKSSSKAGQVQQMARQESLARYNHLPGTVAVLRKSLTF
eukprot:435209-Amphidinium_carterae.2